MLFYTNKRDIAKEICRVFLIVPQTNLMVFVQHKNSVNKPENDVTFYDDETPEYAMDRSYRTHGNEEKCFEHFSEET